MVVLNLYPLGTLEYDDKEIRVTGVNKVIIPMKNVIKIEFNEPTLIKNGSIKITALNMKSDFQCFFRKKRLNDAKIVYNDLLKLSNYNNNLEFIQNNQNTIYCPECNAPLNSKKSTGFLDSSINYMCSKCELKFNFINDKFRLIEVKEKTRLYKYKNKRYTWNQWMVICSGHFSAEEKKELTELILEENTNIICPICDNYLDKYHKKGILSFDSLICSNCNSRFEMLQNEEYRFINSPDKNNKLWNYYNEQLTMDDFYKITGKKITSEKNKDLSKKIKSKTDNINENFDNYKNDKITFKYCPKCGTKVIPHAKFCMSCGIKLTFQNPNHTYNIEENSHLNNIELDEIIKREKEQFSKMCDEEYYFSEESKIKGKQIYADKKQYLIDHPDDFDMKGASIFSTLWSAIDEIPPEEREIYTLTGKGKYIEEQGNYEEAIKIYKEADKLTLKVCADEIQNLTKEHGERDWLYCAKIRQRIRVCKNNLLRDKTKKLEVEAKELEKTNPSKAIEIYHQLNELKPGLKKYIKVKK